MPSTGVAALLADMSCYSKQTCPVIASPCAMASTFCVGLVVTNQLTVHSSMLQAAVNSHVHEHRACLYMSHKSQNRHKCFSAVLGPCEVLDEGAYGARQRSGSAWNDQSVFLCRRRFTPSSGCAMHSSALFSTSAYSAGLGMCISLPVLRQNCHGYPVDLHPERFLGICCVHNYLWSCW